MLKTSIKRDIVDLWRSQGRRLTSPVAVDDRVLLDHLDRDTDSEHEILALLITLDDKRQVRDLLEQLDELQREAIVAVYIDGATQRQAAAEIGITVRALQSRLHKALILLRSRATAQDPQQPHQRPREIPR